MRSSRDRRSIRNLPRTSGVEGPNQRVGNQPLSAASCTTITGHGARMTTSFEVLPSSLARTPLRPREPTTIAAASCRRASSTIVLATALASTVAMGSASSPRSRELGSLVRHALRGGTEVAVDIESGGRIDYRSRRRRGLRGSGDVARAASHTVTTSVLRDGSSLATAATARRAADEPSYAITVGPSSRLTGGSIIGLGHPAQSEFPRRLAGRRTRPGRPRFRRHACSLRRAGTQESAGQRAGVGRRLRRPAPVAASPPKLPSTPRQGVIPILHALSSACGCARLVRRQRHHEVSSARLMKAIAS